MFGFFKKNNLDKYPFSWPKPNVIPYCSIAYLLINAGLTYFFIYAFYDLRWLIPSFALNAFFFWAERHDYLRNKRLFNSWLNEMDKIFGDESKSKKDRWSEGLSAIKRKRSGKRTKNRVKKMKERKTSFS